MSSATLHTLYEEIEKGVWPETERTVLLDFLSFLRAQGIHGAAEIHNAVLEAYIRKRRTESETLALELKILANYALYLGHETLMTEMTLLRDAPTVMERLAQETRIRQGDETWRAVFGGRPMPEIGWTLGEMSDYTRDMEQRQLARVPNDAYRAACEATAHGWTPAWDPHGRETFLREIHTLDALCEKYNQELLHALARCFSREELFFTQEVDEDVIAYVRSHPQYYREGATIYVRRMPFLTKRYLQETNPRKKRYYGCHCPWARESILQDAGPVSRSFCDCSLGLVKKAFEVALDRRLRGRTVTSLLDEDAPLCLFAIEIPPDLLAGYT